MAQDNLVIEVIKRFGSEAKLAAEVGYTQVAINKAKKRAADGKPISAELAVKLERATKGEFRREQFRPDLFGPEPAEEGAAA